MDLTGINLRDSNLRNSLLLSGSLLTVVLALVLYYALRPTGAALALLALICRLTEAGLGVVSCGAGFPGIHASLEDSSTLGAMLQFAGWADANFAALIFTVGSTIYFLLFLRSRSIPLLLSGLGLFASLFAMSAGLAHLVKPSFPSMTMYAWLPMLLAEISTGFWLLIRSVKTTQLAAA